MPNTSIKYIVDIWSDFVCPWCWVAKRRFESALDRFDENDAVQINIRAYRLAANHPPEPMIAALQRKLGNSDTAEAMMNTVIKYGKDAGLDYRFATMQFGDTADAHVLVKAVEEPAVKKALVEALYEQSTSHGRSLFDRSSLEAIAREAGVTEQSIQLAWSSPALRMNLEQDEQAAARTGSGVPMFIFNNEFVLSGAQPEAVFLEALHKLQMKEHVKNTDFAPQLCAIDGCKV